jgi:hypothetical protein
MPESVKMIYELETVWRNEKRQIHRENGPAVEYIDGEKEWWQNGLKHRLEGPAVEQLFGCQWWVFGCYVNIY